MLKMLAVLTIYALVVLGLTCLIHEVAKHYHPCRPKGD